MIQVIVHFPKYAYVHTNEIASPTTILNYNGFLKDTPTGKMQLVDRRGFKVHELLKGYKKAIKRTLVLPSCTEAVGKTLSSKHPVEKSVNRQALMKILSQLIAKP